MNHVQKHPLETLLVEQTPFVVKQLSSAFEAPLNEVPVIADLAVLPKQPSFSVSTIAFDGPQIIEEPISIIAPPVPVSGILEQRSPPAQWLVSEESRPKSSTVLHSLAGLNSRLANP